MTLRSPKKVVRLLGVGFDAEDNHIRITNAEKYDVYMGSCESHEYIQKLIQNIEVELKNHDLSLDDLEPEEFLEFMKSVK